VTISELRPADTNNYLRFQAAHFKLIKVLRSPCSDGPIKVTWQHIDVNFHKCDHNNSCKIRGKTFVFCHSRNIRLQVLLKTIWPTTL